MQRQHSFALILGKECPNTYRTLPEAAVYIHAICTAVSGFLRFNPHQTNLQNCHFCIAKLPLLHCKTATFGMQNAPFWNAKRTVLECKTHRFALQNLHEKGLICSSTGGFFVGNRGKFCAQRDILCTKPRFPRPQRASLLLQQASTICQHFHSIAVLRILLNNSGKCWNTPLYTSIISRFSVF